MEIAVCVKVTYDVQVIRADASDAPVYENVPLKISEFDRYAIEAGVRLKEGVGGRVRMFSVCPQSAREAIKESLARGCDEAYIVHVDRPTSDPAYASHLLASAVRRYGADIVICGEASVDMYSSLVGAMLASRLDMPFIGYASRFQVQGENLLVRRTIDGVVEEVSARLPVVVSVTDKIEKPRTPTLTQILGASRRPVHILSAEDIGDVQPLTRMGEITLFRKERKRKGVDTSDPGRAAETLISELVREGVISR